MLDDSQWDRINQVYELVKHEGDAACEAALGDLIAEVVALRTVLADTTVEEVATASCPEGFPQVDPGLNPAKLVVLWTLAYLKRKAGVTP